jgi:8-oxo-dGTP pyrophosphatase MutT (NUDIX family)
VLSSAEREIAEEAGVPITDLRLRGVVHISGLGAALGVMLFVFTAVAVSRDVVASAEGEPRWYPLDDLPVEQMVHDLPVLLARLFHQGQGHGLVYGNYTALESGEMRMCFREG